MSSRNQTKPRQLSKPTKPRTEQQPKRSTRSSQRQRATGGRDRTPVRVSPARRWRGGVIVGTVLLFSGLAAGLTLGLQSSGPTLGSEGVPLEMGTPLAPARTAATGESVDGLQCDSGMQVIYHVHTHLSVYVNGVVRPLPPGVGIVSPVAVPTSHGPFYEANRCYYWLHVHAQDGVIHIESPSVRTYTLGQFFDIWRQPLTSTQVGPVPGRLTVYVNGRRYSRDPASILLGSHEDIQIDVGTPVVPPLRTNWSGTGL